MKIGIKKMHIEKDVRNQEKRLIYTDEEGTEWVEEPQMTATGFLSTLVKKLDS
ncbi:MAG: hypothetical protein ACRBFS_19555 [Aureispira sp.]